jgi:hypothetical protein
LASFIQQQTQARSGANAVMMTAFGANLQIGIQIGVVQNGFAGGAFAPQAFGHRTFFFFSAFDFWGE